MNNASALPAPDSRPAQPIVRAPLQGNRLHLARLLGVVIAVVTLYVYLGAKFTQMHMPLPPDAMLGLHPDQDVMTHFADFIIHMQFWFEGIIGLTYLGVGLSIFFHKSDDWMAIFVSVALMTFGVAITNNDLGMVVQVPEITSWLGTLVATIGTASFLIFL
jgi:hypothetical protein